MSQLHVVLKQQSFFSIKDRNIPQRGSQHQKKRGMYDYQLFEQQRILNTPYCVSEVYFPWDDYFMALALLASIRSRCFEPVYMLDN